MTLMIATSRMLRKLFYLEVELTEMLLRRNVTISPTL